MLGNVCFGGKVLWGKKSKQSWRKWSTPSPLPHLRVLILTVRTLRNESSSLSLLRIPMWSQVNTALALSFYINTLVNVPHLQKGHIANSTQTFQLTSKPCGCQLSSLERRKHHKRIHFHLLCGGGWNRWWVGSYEQNKFIKIPNKAAPQTKLGGLNVAKSPALCGLL